MHRLVLAIAGRRLCDQYLYTYAGPHIIIGIYRIDESNLTHRSLRCSHAQFIDVDEDSSHDLEVHVYARWICQYGRLCVCDK